MNITHEIPATWPSSAVARPAQPRPALLVLSAAQKLLLPLGIMLLDWLFWLEGAGINALIFTLFVVVAQLILLPRHAAARRSGYVWLAAVGSVFSGAMVAWYGSGAAVLACGVSLALLLGFVNQPHLRLLLFAGLTGLGHLLQAGGRVLGGLRGPRPGGAGLRRGWFYGRLLLGPLVVLAVFHALFVAANPRYAGLSAAVWQGLGAWLARLWPDFSLAHLLFVAVEFFVVAAVVVAVPVHYWADRESRFGEFVRRQRDRVASLGVRRPDFTARRFRPLDLRKEWLAALAAFGLVNALLLVVNAIDVQWLWFGFVPAPGFDLAQFVHEGTWVLIFSILLAMGIVLWFFRRNLNFYAPGRRWLRLGATVWVLQNAVLAASVGLRNYYYILHSGLAYKRIGVCFFLLLVVVGLATVLLKIWQQRSAYSLVRLNALALYAALLALAAGNWEVWIARYNLQPRFQTIDIGFLLDMPGRVLPVLLERRALLDGTRHLTTRGGYLDATVIDAATARTRLDQRVTERQAAYSAHHDWQEWNYADWQANKALHFH